MDGYETTKMIRENRSDYKDIPIIALTAHATSREEKRCLNLGMSDYLSKPFKRDQLLLKLNKWLYKDGDALLNIVSIEKPLIIKSELLENKLIDISYLKEISDGDESFIEEMLTMFKTNTPIQLNLIEKYLNNGSDQELRKIIHKMKSSLGLIGINTATELIQKIELKIDKNKSKENWIDDLNTVRNLCESALKEVS